MISLLKSTSNGAADRFRAMDKVWKFEEYDYTKNTVGSVVPMEQVVSRIVEAYLHRKKGLTDFAALVDSMDFKDQNQQVVGGTKTLSEVRLEMPTKGRFVRDILYNSDDEDSEGSDDVFVQNPLLNRNNFVRRVYELAGNDFKNIKYAEAQAFLREIKYLDKDQYFKITEQEFRDCKDDPSFDLSQNNGFGLTAFLVTVARLRAVPEDKLDNNLSTMKWEGLVKFCLKWMGIISVGVVAAWLLKKMFSMLFSKIVEPLGVEEGPQYDGTKTAKMRAPAKVPYAG